MVTVESQWENSTHTFALPRAFHPVISLGSSWVGFTRVTKSSYPSCIRGMSLWPVRSWTRYLTQLLPPLWTSPSLVSLWCCSHLMFNRHLYWFELFQHHLIFSLDRSIRSASQLSGPANCRWAILSAVCWPSGHSLHNMAQEQSPNGSFWTSAFLTGQQLSELQSSLTWGRGVIPMLGTRGREQQQIGITWKWNTHPVCWLPAASKLWVYQGYEIYTTYCPFSVFRSGHIC